jgi:hypothetical protein
VGSSGADRTPTPHTKDSARPRHGSGAPATAAPQHRGESRHGAHPNSPQQRQRPPPPRQRRPSHRRAPAPWGIPARSTPQPPTARIAAHPKSHSDVAATTTNPHRGESRHGAHPNSPQQGSRLTPDAAATSRLPPRTRGVENSGTEHTPTPHSRLAARPRRRSDVAAATTNPRCGESRHGAHPNSPQQARGPPQTPQRRRGYRRAPAPWRIPAQSAPQLPTARLAAHPRSRSDVAAATTNPRCGESRHGAHPNHPQQGSRLTPGAAAMSRLPAANPHRGESRHGAHPNHPQQGPRPTPEATATSRLPAANPHRGESRHGAHPNYPQRGWWPPPRTRRRCAPGLPTALVLSSTFTPRSRRETPAVGSFAPLRTRTSHGTKRAIVGTRTPQNKASWRTRVAVAGLWAHGTNSAGIPQRRGLRL